MKAEMYTGQCCVDDQCQQAPRNICIFCLGQMCDNHTDGREWEYSDGEWDTIGLICLICVPINTEIRNSPQPIAVIPKPAKTISVDDCMRLQRILEDLK